MFTSLYVYFVPRRNVEAFLQVQKQAATIYRHYGAIDDETFTVANLEAKYGCASFRDVFDVAEDEEIFIRLSRFRDAAHHDEVMAKVDSDERISKLYDEVTALLDISRVLRGEFERIV